MKVDQFVVLFFLLIAVIAIGYFITQTYDELEFTYDPSTGRQSVKARKSSTLSGLTPLTLEGK
jgi:hypothetical protein